MLHKIHNKIKLIKQYDLLTKLSTQQAKINELDHFNSIHFNLGSQKIYTTITQGKRQDEIGNFQVQ